MFGLDAPDEGRTAFAGKQRIFGIVFKVSAAEWASVYIYGRSKPDS